ncbi:BMP family ABC transporter substrate-binding protein [Clostridium sediminicola]|uniref:BMP family ABC transporter substrate-binding protein n=1 Tax=Clostridium sediminicola TaxID=3114879 RepID=UPI0031F2563B
MKKITALLIAMVMALGVLLTGCGSSNTKNNTSNNTGEKVQDEKKTVKVGFVYVGPIGDGGWTDAHNNGRLYLEEQLGVETIYKENVKEEISEVQSVVENMIDEGANVIIGTSFGHMDGIELSAKEHPDVTFMHCSGYKSADNMSNYFGKQYQGRYLSGIAAALANKNNKIGYVAAYEIPEVIRQINAFTLGAQSINPDVEVEVVWTHTWYDPALEKQAAEALIAKGVGLITQHQDTTGPQQAAEEAGLFSIGCDIDMEAAAPNAYLTGVVWNWGPYLVKEVQKVIDGTWEAGSYWENMTNEDDSMVVVTPITKNAPEGTQEKVDAAMDEMLAGKKVFVGPIKDQNGEVKVAEGVELTDKDLLEMNWFVQGVKGIIE